MDTEKPGHPNFDSFYPNSDTETPLFSDSLTIRTKGAVFQELTCSCSCSFHCDLCFIYTKTLENIQNHYDGAMHGHNTSMAPKTVKMCCSICRIREIELEKFRPHLQSVKHLEAVKKLKGKVNLPTKSLSLRCLHCFKSSLCRTVFLNRCASKLFCFYFYFCGE